MSGAADAEWMALPLPALLFDKQGRFAALNDAAQAWLNLSDRSAVGHAPDDPRLANRLRIDPALPQLLQAVLTGEENVSRPALRWEIGDRAGGFDVRMAALHLGPAPDGRVSALIVPAAPVGEHRRAARSAIGMADMLAHEIKNPLAGIRGAAQLLAEGLGSEDRELADLIVAESRRIVALLDQVERFGDTSAPKLQAINIHDVLDRARRSFELTGTHARLVTDYDPSLPLALADPDLIVQAVLNLIRNAAEALARDGRGWGDPRGPGTIRLRTHYDGALRRAEDDTPLPLQVEIEDDGPGVPDAIADQVFDPFISGRENGTGLGLALVSKIAADHGAGLRLDSRPGRTLIRLSLPLAGKEPTWTARS
ncbi:PAS domain-containing protein [Paracoccus sp. Z118]|uniref:two-component system sensor histidine kinase NtrB n=1 Tax=Paracoccus sp. Z118 TaxID=2851017 RepID=UPI001C2B8140|nr:ATP-binding protein [Paracoccus sp. Z118]MBV0892013.1 PAS domain-containing protein [Paracoccus sp. Z118]